MPKEKPAKRSVRRARIHGVRVVTAQVAAAVIGLGIIAVLAYLLHLGISPAVKYIEDHHFADLSASDAHLVTTILPIAIAVIGLWAAYEVTSSRWRTLLGRARPGRDPRIGGALTVDQVREDEAGLSARELYNRRYSTDPVAASHALEVSLNRRQRGRPRLWDEASPVVPGQEIYVPTHLAVGPMAPLNEMMVNPLQLDPDLEPGTTQKKERKLSYVQSVETPTRRERAKMAFSETATATPPAAPAISSSATSSEPAVAEQSTSTSRQESPAPNSDTAAESGAGWASYPAPIPLPPGPPIRKAPEPPALKPEDDDEIKMAEIVKLQPEPEPEIEPEPDLVPTNAESEVDPADTASTDEEEWEGEAEDDEEDDDDSSEWELFADDDDYPSEAEPVVAAAATPAPPVKVGRAGAIEIAGPDSLGDRFATATTAVANWATRHPETAKHLSVVGLSHDGAHVVCHFDQAVVTGHPLVCAEPQPLGVYTPVGQVFIVSGLAETKALIPLPPSLYVLVPLGSYATPPTAPDLAGDSRVLGMVACRTGESVSIADEVWDLASGPLERSLKALYGQTIKVTSGPSEIAIDRLGLKVRILRGGGQSSDSVASLDGNGILHAPAIDRPTFVDQPEEAWIYAGSLKLFPFDPGSPDQRKAWFALAYIASSTTPGHCTRKDLVEAWTAKRTQRSEEVRFDRPVEEALGEHYAVPDKSKLPGVGELGWAKGAVGLVGLRTELSILEAIAQTVRVREFSDSDMADLELCMRRLEPLRAGRRLVDVLEHSSLIRQSNSSDSEGPASAKSDRREGTRANLAKIEHTITHRLNASLAAIAAHGGEWAATEVGPTLDELTRRSGALVAKPGRGRRHQ